MIGGVADDLAATWRWNLRVAVPPDGFDVVDGLIEVPYRVSPTATAEAGATLRFGGREFRVRETTAVVLPTEIVLAAVDPRTFRIRRCVHEGTGLRGDGLKITSGGVGLPTGILVACGFDPDAPEAPTLAAAAATVLSTMASPFKDAAQDARWT